MNKILNSIDEHELINSPDINNHLFGLLAAEMKRKNLNDQDSKLIISEFLSIISTDGTFEAYRQLREFLINKENG